MEEIKIELEYDFENLNEMIRLSRGNRYGANNQKKQEMQFVRFATLKTPKITEYPIKIEVIWHVKNKNFDLDNKIIKNILDGLVNARILKNDNYNCINEITYKAIIDNEEKVELTLMTNKH